MAQILDQHLDHLLCSQCQKYLSVFPVKLCADGGVKCGRCCKKNKKGVVSLYEDIAKHCLFNCINRYEGCRKLLLPSEVVTHEITCIGRSYKCPKASRKMNENQYLYIQDNNIFIIFLKLHPDEQCLCISAVTLRKLENVKQQFFISADSISFKQVTVRQPCLSLENFNNNYHFKIDVSKILTQFIKIELILDLSETSSACSYEVQMYSKQLNQMKKLSTYQQRIVELTPSFRKTYPHYKLTPCGTALYSSKEFKRIELTCSNCTQVITTIGFVCMLKEHPICYDCRAWCGICECFTKARNVEMAGMIRLLSFPCKWKCGSKFNSDVLNTHESYCDLNKRRCPICMKIMSMKFLQNHLNIVHQCELVQMYSLTQFEFVRMYSLTQFLKNYPKSRDNYYFIINKVMFKIRWSVNNGEYSIHVTLCDSMRNLELFVITKSGCKKLDNGKITVDVDDDPSFYLKHLH